MEDNIPWIFRQKGKSNLKSGDYSSFISEKGLPKSYIKNKMINRKRPAAFGVAGRGRRRPIPSKASRHATPRPMKSANIPPKVPLGKAAIGAAMGGAANIILNHAVDKGYRFTAEALNNIVGIAAREFKVRTEYEIKRILNPPGLTGRPDRTVPCVTKNGVSVTKNLGTIEPKRAFKTKVVTGNPSSKTLLEIGKENGIETRVVFDSKMTAGSTFGEGGENPPLINREVLSHACGFNCRNFAVLGSTAFVNRRDLDNEFFLGYVPVGESDPGNPSYLAGTAPVHSSSKTLISMLDTTVEFTFHNQSRFLPLVMKVHIVASTKPTFRGTEEPSTDIRDNCYKLAQNFGTIPNIDREGIPSYYLLPEAKTEEDDVRGANGYHFSFHMLNTSKGLLSSPYFRDNYTIVETKQKTLEASDTWQFKHEHQYGSGIDLDVVANTITGIDGVGALNQKGIPLNYFYIVEIKGLPCEGTSIRNNNPNGLVSEPRFGTSPGRYFYEFRKTIRFVRPSEDQTDIIPGTNDSSGNAGGPRVRRIHSRTFLRNETDYTQLPFISKPFYRLPSQIGTGQADQESEQFFIPIEIESEISYAGAASKAGNSDNDPNAR